MSGANKLQIFEQIIFGICSLILSVCFVRLLSIICEALDISLNDNSFVFIIGYSLMNVVLAITISLLLLTLYVNHRYRNLFERVRNDDKAILHFICLPSGIFCLICDAVYSMSTLYVPGKATELFVFSILFFILTVVLGVYIVEANTHHDFGEEWMINFMNLITSLSSLIFLTMHVVISLLFEQAEIFTMEMKNRTASSPHATTGSFTDIMTRTNGHLHSYYYKFIFIFDVTCVMFLVRPIKRHYRLIQRSKGRLPHSSIDGNSLEVSKGYYLPMMLLSIVSVMIVIIVVIVQPFSVHIGNILMCLLYVGCIINSFYIFSDMMKSPEKGHKNYLLYGLLSLGLFGQTVEVLTEILYSISLDAYPFILFQDILCVVQCHIQTLLLSFFLNRRRIQFAHSSLSSFLYSPEVLIFSNIGFLALNCYNLFAFRTVTLPQNLFLQLVRSASFNITYILTIIYRLTSLIILSPPAGVPMVNIA